MRMDVDWQYQCPDSAYPYPDCRREGTKEMWRRFTHSPWAVLGFAVAFFVLLLIIGAVLIKRSLLCRRALRSEQLEAPADENASSMQDADTDMEGSRGQRGADGHLQKRRDEH